MKKFIGISMKKIIDKKIDMDELCSTDIWETTYKDCTIVCAENFNICNCNFINCKIISSNDAYGNGHGIKSGFNNCRFIKTTIMLAGSCGTRERGVYYNECYFRHSMVTSDSPYYGIGLLVIENSTFKRSRILDLPNKDIKWTNATNIYITNCLLKDIYIDTGGYININDTNTENVLVCERYKQYPNTAQKGIIYI